MTMEKSKSEMLHIIINDTVLLEYDRNKPIPEEQYKYLDQMDAKMKDGITLGKDKIDKPNTLQCAQYIANSLISALFEEDYNLGIALCTYLAQRIPDLQQVKAVGEKNEVSVEFIFDRSLEKSQQEQKIEFYNPNFSEKTKH